ncbi:hypothetical protein AB0H18_38075 [Streptomyces sp. NPDC020766]|uniref:hypothetical protein n=1 Tax=Streptomyces sp. NPDC020766 TaxID=3155011 RepID=UPI0033D96601
MSHSSVVAVPEQGAPQPSAPEPGRTRGSSWRRTAGPWTHRRLPKPALFVLQLLLVAMVATAALVTTSGSASAQDEPPGALPQATLPGVMYRGDSRHVNDIFATGFQARGTNYDLIAHVRGDRALQSGYISTTGTQSVAEQFARSQGMVNLAQAAAEPRCQGGVWAAGQSLPFIGWLVTSHCEHQVVEARTFVYTINPQFAGVILHVPDELRGNPELHSHYASQDEWAFFHRIPPQAITGVHIYEMEGRAAGTTLMPQSITFHHERWVANPNYDPHFRYDPYADRAADLTTETPLNIPEIQANPGFNRGCNAIERCRGGDHG